MIALWERQRAFRAVQPLELDTVDVLDGRDHVVVLTRSRTETDAWSTANVYQVRDGRIAEVTPFVHPLGPFDAYWSR